MKKVLLLLSIIGLSNAGFCGDRFQTDAERTHELLRELNEHIQKTCSELKKLNSSNEKGILLLKKIHDVAINYQVEEHLQKKDPQAESLMP